MRLPVAARPGTLVAPRRKRFSILVTSPTDEPTRSLVVVNLAAVFAEAGDRVLVATTGGMRTEVEGNGKGPKSWEGPDEDMDAAELVANARPSQIPGVSSLALGQLFSNPSRFALQAPALVEAARDVVDVLLLEAPLLRRRTARPFSPPPTWWSWSARPGGRPWPTASARSGCWPSDARPSSGSS